MPTVINGIRACIFDAYGTLFNIHAPVGRIAGELDGKGPALSDTWRLKQLQYTWLRALMGAHADFETVTGKALDFALAAHGIDEAHGFDATDLRRRLMDLYMTLDAYPDVPATLARLQDMGKTTGILSNGNPAMLEAAVSSAGLAGRLDHVLSVEEIGIYKPAPRVYALVCDRLGITASQVCFVSTNGWDAQAAAFFGFQTVWLNRFDMTEEKLPGRLSATISGLEELAPLLS
jgi:2-haloacid dehalogenase